MCLKVFCEGDQEMFERLQQPGHLGAGIDELTAAIEAAESRIAEIDAAFCAPGYFEQTPPEEVATLRTERAELEHRVERMLAEWEALEQELEAIG
jgi:hypothetical protein